MALKITRKDPKVTLVPGRNLSMGDTILVGVSPAIVTFTSTMNKVVRALKFGSANIVELGWSAHYNMIDCELTYTMTKEDADDPA